MSDISTPLPSRLAQIDKVWLAFAVILAGVAVLTPQDFTTVFGIMLGALTNTAVFILFAVAAVAYMKASGAETLLAKAFTGAPVRMIVLGALAGGLSPFCSCEVIPFIAALLALGAPLAAVMAFWLASPLMDPAMFIITASALGLDFAVAKTVSAVGLGLLGGFGTLAFQNSAVFVDPLKAREAKGGCCGAKKPFQGEPVWAFWTEPARHQAFRESAIENGLFLLKWLALAYLIEALMIRHIPAELVATVLGGTGIGPVVLGALVGAPAYLNGYAAVPLMAGLLDQGMAPGAAMSFVLAGGVSSIPAAMAVWALVKPRVFAAYLGFALVGSILAGLTWGLIA
ncbi:MAG: permease [Pseudomonadota bacterium]